MMPKTRIAACIGIGLGTLGVAAAVWWLAFSHHDAPTTTNQHKTTGTARATPAGHSPAISAEQAPCPIQFRDMTEPSGIVFAHTDGSSGRRYIAETISSGLAAFDFDGDGLIDIYFPNGTPLPGANTSKLSRHALYKNLGGWRFRDVTESAGVACTGYGEGVVVGDYDNDGCPDLYVSNFGPKVLYHNNGNGTFTDVTQRAGVADSGRMGAGASFLDIDGDGHLDLFAANYVKFAWQAHVVLHRGDYQEYAGPKEYPPDRQTLFRNNGDGTFADVSESSGIARHLGKGMGVVSADYDNDGDTDLFVLNDVFGNFCFRNDGHGKFEEVSLENGFKYSGDGSPLGSMGVDCADFDNDGWLDFYQTSYDVQLPVLFRNLGNGNFEDVTMQTGAGRGTLHNVKWGCGFVDFDNDGRRDLLVAMGHIQDEIDHYDSTTSYKTHNVLLRNVGGRFVDVSEAAGLRALPPHSARGAAFDDLDNDGAVDVVLLNSRERPTILQNMYYAQGGKNHWLALRLQGVKTNRDGIGARVRVTAGELVQIDEVHSGRGYQGHFGSRLHFGLGEHTHVDRIEVHWIGGGADVYEDLGVDQLATLVEGAGRRPSFPFRQDP